MLDNIPHIKAFWIATGVDVAQMALWYGADDLDGTVQEERIYHMAGSRTPETLDDGRHPAPDPRRRARAGGAGHAVQPRRGRARSGREGLSKARVGLEAQGAGQGSSKLDADWLA